MSQVVVLVTFQDPSGQPLSGGKAEFSLSYDISTGNANGPQVSAGRKVTATLNSSGSTSVLLYPNDTLVPAGSVYRVTAYSALGQPVWTGDITALSTGPSYILLEDGTPILLESGTGAILLET